MAGICSYGGYVPRYRLNRMQVYKTMGWMNPAVRFSGAGRERGRAQAECF
ncbi:MAG: hypothetical protein JRH15_15205 [Deltaproteobacteria bacterium]|nr:hypothetical protein [Deltaproteobacteria bacterium]